MFKQLRTSAGKFGQTKIGRPFAKAMSETIGRKAGLLGNAFTLYEVYRGYQEGGVMGAAKGFGVSYGFNLASRLLLKSTLGPVAAVAAVGIGTYQFGKKAGEYGKKMSGLEMATPYIDQFGTMATMRQRSLQAIQNTHLNGRAALGSEAQILHKVLR